VTLNGVLIIAMAVGTAMFAVGAVAKWLDDGGNE
jgi:hypothetical protein